MSDLDLLVARMVAAGAKRVYKVGAVPASPAAPYAVLAVDSGAPINRREGGGAPTKVRRMTAQLFGQSWEAVMAMADYADDAFDDVSLSDLAGEPYCFRELQTPVTRDPDAEVLLYILHTYRF